MGTIDAATIAREVLAGNLYMTLATADAAGRPWASPVFFTADGTRDFYWVSSPEARHSHNIAARPEVGIVVFDSGVAIGGAEAVYMSATAVPVADDELEACARIFNARLPAARRFEPDELCAPAPFRLYRATVTQHDILLRGGDPENRRGADDRKPVDFGAETPR